RRFAAPRGARWPARPGLRRWRGRRWCPAADEAWILLLCSVAQADETSSEQVRSTRRAGARQVLLAGARTGGVQCPTKPLPDPTPAMQVRPALLWAASLLLFASAAPARAGDKARERATAEIKKLGGTVAIDEKLPGKPVVGVVLEGKEVTDAAL